MRSPWDSWFSFQSLPTGRVVVVMAIATLLAAADAAKGQSVAKACMACHDFAKGGPNRAGPNLWGVVGRKHGSAAGFAYSEAMAAKSAGSGSPRGTIAWNNATWPR